MINDNSIGLSLFLLALVIITLIFRDVGIPLP